MSHQQQFVGEMTSYDAANGWMDVEVKNRFAVGDRIEVIHPSGNREISLERMENAEATPISVAPGNGHRVWIPLPVELPGALLARFV